jgi:hypothetical protein
LFFELPVPVVSMVPILQLALSGREIEIATGLAADDRIIVTPLDGVADGDKVRIADGSKTSVEKKTSSAR